MLGAEVQLRPLLLSVLLLTVLGCGGAPAPQPGAPEPSGGTAESTDVETGTPDTEPQGSGETAAGAAPTR